MIMYNLLMWYSQFIEIHKLFWSFVKYIWVILVIRSGWEILRFILVRSRLIIHPKKSSSVSINIVTYYFLVHSIVSISSGLSHFSSVSYVYTMTIVVQSSFTTYNRPLSLLHCLNPYLRVIVLMYYLDQPFDSCTRTQIHWISVYKYSYFKGITPLFMESPCIIFLLRMCIK